MWAGLIPTSTCFYSFIENILFRSTSSGGVTCPYKYFFCNHYKSRKNFLLIANTYENMSLLRQELSVSFFADIKFQYYYKTSQRTPTEYRIYPDSPAISIILLRSILIFYAYLFFFIRRSAASRTCCSNFNSCLWTKRCFVPGRRAGMGYYETYYTYTEFTVGFGRDRTCG
jgi:hypothetical protein